jgi:hypothetical protein
MVLFSSLDDDPAIPSIDLWEDLINGKMKAVFGWGEEKDMSEFVSGGVYGVGGLLQDLEYYIVHRGVDSALFEGKSGRLMEKMSKR